uniref:Chromosome partition protein Smc n=1 Tax=Desulfatirhabdium butyrativorans TaxID=340467 RepID=A0A7C4VRC7_9BACT
MIIKQLDMTGFKSFANRTVIEFVPGICAVVGPNGCGKSNVLDALRWVMGEQSARQLRGKAMEDVIFAGTGNQSPVSMAEVSLLLSTSSDAAHPVVDGPGLDSPDVQITRRLHRSGESEYLINRQPCRLKDIHQLLMGHGTIGKSYAVIQQGNIGAITEATPEERRQYLDEASGAMRYKSKRQEVARKIEETRENLQRLDDILTEIKRQMAVLQRQAKRAKAYLELQGAVQRMEILYGLHIVTREDAFLEELAERKRRLQEHVQTHRQVLEEKTAAVGTLRARLEEAGARSRDVADRLQHLERRIERTTQETDYLKVEVGRLQKERDECLDGVRRIEERAGRQEEERAALAKREEALKREIEGADVRLRESRKVEAECRGRIETLKAQIEAIRKAVLTLSADEAKTLQASQTAVENRRQAERNLKRIAEELLAARRSEEVLDGQKREVESEIDELDGRMADMEERIDRQRRTLTETTAVFRQWAERVRSLQDKRRGIDIRLTTLRKLASAYEGFSAAAKAVLRDWPKRVKSEGGGSPGSPVAVADVLRVDSGYELAVEVVLNDALQWVMLDTVDRVRSAIDFLAEHPAGRCGFVLSTSESAIPMASISSCPIGEPLIDRVRFSCEIPALRALLESVRVVETREEALNACGLLTAGQRIVSRDGVLVGADGVILTGYGVDPTGLLSRKSEIEQAEAERNDCLQEIAEAERAMKQAEAEVTSGEKTLSRLLEELQEDREDRQEAEKRRIQLEERWKHLRRNLDILLIEQERLSGEETDSEDESLRLQTTLGDIRQALRIEQERLETAESEREGWSRTLDALQQERQTVQVTLTSAQANVENVRDSIRRLDQARKEGRRQAEQMRDRLQTIEKQQAECTAKLERNRKSIEQGSRELEGLRTEAAAWKVEIAALDEKRVHLEETIRGLLENRDTTERQLQEIEIEWTEHRGVREHALADIHRITNRPISELRLEMQESLQNPAFDGETLLEEIQKKREQLMRFPEINTAAIRELAEIRQRHDFLETQKADLLKAMEDLQTAIRKIDRATRESFLETFHAVNAKIAEVFPQLFEGGMAGLVMTDPDNPLESGVEFMIQPPGKRLTRISLLSGGEKALCAIAFIFSIFLIRPASFCLLDEIDAPLDEANVLRFNRLLDIVGENAQIIIATHNRRTMAFADMLIGVTMETKGISRIVPVKWEDVNHLVKEAN